MRFLLLTLLLFIFYSCGKPPLLNKQESLKHSTHYQSVRVNDYSADLYWNESPKAYSYLSAQLEFRVNNILSSLPLGSEVYLWMPSMGHGGPDIRLEEISQGIYKLDEIYFIMEGDWQIIIKLPTTTTTLNFNYDI